MFHHFFFFENSAVYEIMWRNTVKSDMPQVTICAHCLLDTWLQTHAQSMQYSLLFHSNNGCTNAPQCHVCMHIACLV